MKSTLSAFIVLGCLIMGSANADILRALPPAKNIIFVAPHPDDEMAGMGGQIYAAEHTPGVNYRVVLMTCGDGYTTAINLWKNSGEAKDFNNDGKIDYIDLGIQRHQESLNALATLGVPPEKVIFLGYPDGSLKDFNNNAPVLTPLTNVSAVPYDFAYRPGAPYIYNSPVQDLAKIFKDMHADLVYSTTPTDEHPDHAMTNEFVRAALKQFGKKSIHLEYLIHWEQHMNGWPFLGQFHMPKGHIRPDYTAPLPDGLTSDMKLLGLHQYVTQVATDGQYILNFAKDTEHFWNERPNVSDYLTNHQKRTSEVF